MRRSLRAGGADLAWSLFESAPCAQLASTDPDGDPVLRTLNVVVLEDEAGPYLAMHGAPAGEKLGCLGRPAVFGVSEVLTTIPSTWTHPERACPATTWYRSAQAHGVLEAVDDPGERATILQALMDRFQPEGGHRPIVADDPMYAAALRGLMVARLRPTRIESKRSIGQDKDPAWREAVLERLWSRGGPGDLAALSAALEEGAWPAFLSGPDGLRITPGAPWDDRIRDLLRLQEWNGPFTDEALAAMWSASARVIATQDGRLLGTARAVSDGVKFAYIGDVAVAADAQGQGIGAAMMRTLLDHPEVRGARRVILRTRIAAGFYEKLGFRTMFSEGDRPWMVRP
jgi:ribosomal protein S18 acetylase RimI-like enzyme